jgi:hypothetical protein
MGRLSKQQIDQNERAKAELLLTTVFFTLIKAGKPFTSDDVARLALPLEIGPRWLPRISAALFRRFSSRKVGYIRKVGYKLSDRASNASKPIGVWISTAVPKGQENVSVNPSKKESQ